VSFTHKLDLQTQQLRALETATLSTGLSMAGTVFYGELMVIF
jgi:hypothetical protein